MEAFLPVEPTILVYAWIVAFIAALVKGAIGFAMPTILVSGFTIFLPTDTAIAAMIIPTLISNLQQALDGGFKTARRIMRPFRGFIVLLLVLVVIGAQIFAQLDDSTLYILLGLPIFFFSLFLLLGWQLPFLSRANPFSGWIIAVVSGVGGGIAGIWGLPIALYLNALKLRKKTQFHLQGIIYGLCALVFFLAHIGSGVMGLKEFWLSCLIVPVTIIGMKSGIFIQDRISQAHFRRITLFALIILGANLIRKGALASGAL